MRMVRYVNSKKIGDGFLCSCSNPTPIAYLICRFLVDNRCERCLTNLSKTHFCCQGVSPEIFKSVLNRNLEKIPDLRAPWAEG